MNILVTEPLPGRGIEFLSQHYNVRIGSHGVYDHEETLAEAVSDCDALLSCLSNPVTRRVLQAAPRLKIVANYAVGYNNIDTQAAQELGIRVSNTPDVLTETTADCAFALLLGVARNVRAAETQLRNGEFDGWHPHGFLGAELYGKTAGIVGLGRIGQAFARRARGFGMRILYFNRNRVHEALEQELQATFVSSIDELTTSCDILSLHCPLTSQTHHLLDARRLAAMRPHAIIINTARGPVIDEQALAEALHSGHLGGAGLDVFEEEPRIHPRLLTAPRTMLLPHIGSATHETRAEMSMMAARSIADHLQGRPDSDIPNLVVRPGTDS